MYFICHSYSRISKGVLPNVVEITGKPNEKLTEGLLEVHQAGHLWGHVIQVCLQSSAHQQRVGQVSDVDAHNGKRKAGGR